ncbi:DUF3152 domain-containing protein [Dactylosporangium roseum]|uniref:DUF3152 domain-containing protein n=3 Tax=Dactylosporangium roseum TaxID=47989 RepID=A0ABY5Z5I4_9ACTN|nr:DUF3152 domain-containing protein [Dactylosporangium roseum]
MLRMLMVAVLLLGVTACGSSSDKPDSAAAPGVEALASVTDSPEAPPSPAASPSAKPSSKKPAPKPSATLKKPVNAGGDTGGAKPVSPGADGVPMRGAGTFTVASGGTEVVGGGATLVRYRVEIEDGIQWGGNPVWTPAETAAEVERAIGAPRGWTLSAEHPVTYGPNRLADASWSFQRVSGTDFSVRLRLATPDTVDKLCASVGVNTQGIYSCRYGQTILLNLRRWLKGIAGHPGEDFHANTINHEMGHFLGFDHMKCPGSGPAPIMQTQTIALNGCTMNSFPFTTGGAFVQGPWAPS